MRYLFSYFKSHIRFKIILPFAVLTLMVAITGVYLSTRLVSESLEERFTRQLIESASVAADSVAQREEVHLSTYRTIAFTEGIADSINASDYEKLVTLVFPHVANSNIGRVDIVDADGNQLLEIRRPPGSKVVEDYTQSSGADLADLPVVQKVLAGMADFRGDKFVALLNINGDKLLVTAGPVKQGGQIVGAVLVSSHVRDLLRSLTQATFSEISLFDLEGRLIDTTLPISQQDSQILAIGPESRAMLGVDGETSLRRSVSLRGREYDSLYGVFRAREEPIGIYAVALPTSFMVSYSTTARNQMFLIFAVALLLVFGIGYLTANIITGQLQHLMESALAVAGGDFSRRPQISSSDEIGSLAQSLDHMTESLAGFTRALQDRIDELEVLYASSTAVTVKLGLNLKQVLQAVTTTVQEVFRTKGRVIVYLFDEEGQVLVPRAAAPSESHKCPSLGVTGNGRVSRLLTEARPQVVSLTDLETYAKGGSFAVNGISNAVIAPLIAAQEPIGALILVPDSAFLQTKLLDEDTERLLGTLANQAAIAIKNAQLFEATQRAYEELRQLDDLKTQFINIAAHELRTPLGAMLGYASFVEKRVPPKLQKSMRFLNVSMLRMRTMIDAMLAIQRLDAGTAFLRLASVDIRDVIRRVLTDYQAVAELEGHTIQINIPDKLPPVEADAEKIYLVLSNLLSNAIKFMPEGGIIEVTVQDYIKGVLISVSDSGPGIAVEDYELIFERFYQTRQEHMAGHGGMGIGLTIVKHLVELHEGQVWVESEVGEGTTFFFTLPRDGIDDGTEKEPPVAEADTSPELDRVLEAT